MAQRIIIIVLLVLLGLVMLMLRPPAGGAMTPAEVVWKHTPDAQISGIRAGPEDLAGCLRLCWWMQPKPSAVVLYRRLGNDGPEYGSTLVMQSGGGWHGLVDSGLARANSDPATPRPSLLVDFVSSQIPPASATWRFGVKRTYLLTYGYVRSARVTAVEVTFNTGQVLRDQVTAGMFAIFADAEGICEARLLDKAGHILQTIGPADIPWTAHQLDQQASIRCGS